MNRRMKDSGIEWIGEIPEEWEVAPLKRYSSVCNGKEVTIEVEVDKNHEDNSEIIDVYGSGGVFKHTNDYLHNGESVLFGRKGTIGKPLYVKGKFWTVDTMYFMKFEAGLIPKYCYYHFIFYPWDIIMTKTALPSVVGTDIASTLFIVPPIPTQQAIANFLDQKCSEIDHILEKTRESIEEYKKLKQSIITEAVTKGLDRNVEMKESGIEWIGEIPKHWEVMPHKYIMFKKKELCAIYAGEDILSLTMRGVIKRDLENPSGKMPTSFDGYQKIYKGNLLLCLFDIDVTPRCVGLIEDEGLTSPAYSQFQFLNKDIAKYYYYLLLNIDYTKEFLHLSKNLRSSLTEDDFGDIKTILPPILEQQQISDYLDQKCSEIDSLISQKQTLLTDLEAYKKSLIFECVTGKREVGY